ncbi:MAG: hypothetical protein CVT99_05765 [Bacteroidetes bacterium HGW-Bacteroidetes-16]|jgi:CO/xanthine dehydrogenase FAD-binding subunit|nr:MAG: hypothetical protein CVT99_05765 [Bacteroidetes bacterium HGW-Bacteroidetes-16]
MKMTTPPDSVPYFTPETISEALELINNKSNLSFISGATDVMVNRQQGNFESDGLVDLTNIIELTTSCPDGDEYKIGAAVKLSEIIANPYINEYFQVIVEAAKSVATPLIRNQATIGGNLLCENRCIFYNQSALWREAAGYCLKCGGDICIATGGKKSCLSKFVSDMAPALISLNAKVVMVDKDSESVIPLEYLYSGDGIKSKMIDRKSILKFILLPLNQHIKSTFKKLRQRKTLEFTSLTIASTLHINHCIKMALSGIAPNPIVVNTEKGIPFDAIYEEINRKAKIINNDFFDRQYRKTMLKTYLVESLTELNSL